MRKTVIAVMVLACLAAFTVPAYCEWRCVSYPRPEVKKDASAHSGDCLQKLGRGFLNCITFIMEVPQQISNVNRTDSPLAAFTWGILKGIGMSGVRAGVGIYEIVTFPLPCPEGYKPILTDPEYFFSDNIL